jgi:hypothetical protein
MMSEPRPSDREVLTGLVERVTYQNAENGFCVIRVKAGAAASWSPWSAMPPRSRPASGSRQPAAGSTTAPTASSSRPGSSRPPRPPRSRASRSTWPRRSAALARSMPRSSCAPSARRYSTSSRRSRIACGRWTASVRYEPAALRPPGPSRRQSARSRSSMMSARPGPCASTRRRCRAGHVGESVLPGPQYPWHRVQDRRCYRHEGLQPPDPPRPAEGVIPTGCCAKITAFVLAIVVVQFAFDLGIACGGTLFFLGAATLPGRPTRDCPLVCPDRLAPRRSRSPALPKTLCHSSM